MDLFNYDHETATTAGKLLSGNPGAILAGVNVNKASTAGGLLTIYDDINANTAANQVAIIDLTIVFSYSLPLSLKRGLFIVLATAVGDVTIIYR